MQKLGRKTIIGRHTNKIKIMDQMFTKEGHKRKAIDAVKRNVLRLRAAQERQRLREQIESAEIHL